MTRVQSGPGKQRATVMLALFGLASAVIVARSGFIQLMDKDYFEEKFVEKSFMQEELVPARRGMFLDRNGSPIAASSPLYLMAIDPKQMGVLLRKELRDTTDFSEEEISAKALHIAKEKVAAAANLYNINPKALVDKFEAYYRNDRQYLVISKDATPAQARETQGIIPQHALIQSARYQRQYPDGEVIGSLVGYTHKDNSGAEIMQERGVEGLERVYETTLAGVPRRVKMIMARDGESLEELEVLEERQDGADIQLSIDRRIQYFAYEALKKGLEKNNATAGSVVVMRPNTGEILAMVNLPTINPNNITTNELQSKKNFSLITPIEPGSTVKPLTVALGLETGVINENTPIDTGNGVMKVGEFKIRDVSRRGVITAGEVIKFSSNIGASKIAKMIGANAMHRWYEQLGFGQQTALRYPGETRGVLRPARQWYESGLYTHSYGYGFQVNLVQLLKAYTVIANDGVLVEPSLLKRDEASQKTPLLTAATARQVRKMMVEVVEREGAGAKAARVPGFTVAGKTGTVHVVQNGSYQENRYRSLFLGMIPADAPELLAVVMIDNPRSYSEGERVRYGSLVAAPIFGEIMKDATRVLGMTPSKFAPVVTASAE